jgi:RNA polymerase sigma-70 factor, ECF subfamily
MATTFPAHGAVACTRRTELRGSKNRFETSFVWMDAMQDFTARLASRTREGLLGDPTSTMTEERFLRLAGSELDRTYRLAGFLLGDAHEAEDATQEALIRAWRSIGSLRDPDGFRPWFDRILVNLCRDRLRGRRRIRFIPLDGTAELVHARDPFAAVLDRDEVLGRLNMLDSDERIVVVLHYWADLTLVAVAQRLGWPIGTVKSRLHRALDTMAGSPGGRGER